MKNVLIMITLMMCLVANGQWTNKIIHSDFDGSFKRSFTATNNYGFLMMEEGDTVNKPFLGLSGIYFYDDETFIDFVLIVKGINKSYQIDAELNEDSDMYYIDESIWTDEFVTDFKSASRCSIRVNQSNSRDMYYTFNFSRSTAAFNFITQ